MQATDELNTIQKATTLKDEGNRFFVSGNFSEALDAYEQAILLLFPNFQNFEEQITQKIVNFERKSPALETTNESSEEKESKQPENPQIIEKRTLTKEVPSQYHSILSIILGNKAACYSSLNLFEQSVKYCTYSLELDSKYTKALLRRAKAYESMDKLREALADYKQALEIDPSLNIAKHAMIDLPPRIKEQEEKLKKEALDKLKQIGNSILGVFGMNLDSFQFTQDPNTGSYNIGAKK